MTNILKLRIPRHLPRWITPPALGQGILLLILVPSTLISVRSVSIASIEWIVVLALFILGLMFQRTLPRFSLAPLLLLVLPVISTALHFGMLGNAWQGGLVNLLGGLLLYIVLKPQLTVAGLHKALRLLVLLSVPVALLAAVQYAMGVLPILDSLNQHEFQTSQLVGRLSSTLGHPILLGTYSGFVTLLLLLLSNLQFSPVSRGLLIGLNLATLWASGSRSSIIPLILLAAAMLVRWLWWQLRRRRITLLHLLVIWSLLLGAWLVAVLGIEVDLSRFQNVQSSYSYLYRTQQWAGGWAQLSQSPLMLALGNGMGSTVVLFSNVKFTLLFGPATFDNAYMTLLYEIGFLGLTVVLLPLVAALRRGGVGAFCVAFLLFNAFFYDSFRWPVFDLLLVLSVLMTHLYRPQLPNRDNRHKPWESEAC